MMMETIERVGLLVTGLIVYALVGAFVLGNYAKRHPKEDIWDVDNPASSLGVTWPIYLAAMAIWWALLKHAVDWVTWLYEYARGPVPEEECLICGRTGCPAGACRTKR